MNQMFLVGRLTRDPVLRKHDGRHSCFITLAIKRQYKSPNGIYETDFINCTVWNVIAERICEYCRKGDLVSVKAHIQNNNYIDKEDKPVYTYEIIADQISFMQSQKTQEEIENEEKSADLVNAE